MDVFLPFDGRELSETSHMKFLKEVQLLGMLAVSLSYNKEGSSL